MLDHSSSPTSSDSDSSHHDRGDTSRYVLRVEPHFAEKVTEYAWREVTVDFKTGQQLSCRTPVSWSNNAAATLMSKYAVRKGVPDEMGGVNGREVDAERIFDRLVAGWRAAAIEHGYWTEDDPNIDRFCAEIKAMLEQQVAAPNSPQWFNTGVAVQYGIKAGSDGHYKATQNAQGDWFAHRCADSLEYPQISACFIQSVADNLVGEGGIMDLWQREARLFKYGSGSGANYSALRGKGEPLSRGGESSGLLSFLRVGDRSAGAIKSGGTTRRSARIVVVDADHPDIEDFVAWKPREDAKIRALHAAGFGDASSFEDEATETVSGQNANNSVRVTDEFMRAAISGGSWDLTARVDGSVVKTVNAYELFEGMAGAAWACADPGLQFADTINDWHTCPADGRIHSANPCSEYVFLDDTACNLASLNLAKFHGPLPCQYCRGRKGSYEPGVAHTDYWVSCSACDGKGRAAAFDWTAYKHAARLWTIVLDLSVSMAGYPTAKIARRSMLYRTLGLGYAALGELLVLLGLGYGTLEGRTFAEKLTSTLTRTAYLTSTELAQRLGVFPRYKANKEHVLGVINRHARCASGIESDEERDAWQTVYVNALRYGVRNAQVSLLAPCGTIGIVMDCETTSGEPYYSDTTIKTLAGGGTMRLASKRFAEVLRQRGHNPDDYTRRAWTVEDGRVREYVWVEPPAELERVLVCADDVTPRQHVAMMAAVQPFLSGAISKTVNMSSTATVEDVADLYTYAWRQGLKSIAIYRDGCKPAQPLQGRKPAPGVQTFPTREAAEIFAAAAERAAPSSTLHKLGSDVAADGNVKRTSVVGGLSALSKSLIDVGVRYENEQARLKTIEGFKPASLQRGERLNPPDSSRAVKTRVELSGHTFYLICGEHDDGSLAEVFVTCSRTGSAIAGWVNAWAKQFSLSLQHGTPLDVLVAASLGEQFEPGGYHDGHPVLSPVDAFARIIEATYLAKPQVERAAPPVLDGGTTQTFTFSAAAATLLGANAETFAVSNGDQLSNTTFDAHVDDGVTAAPREVADAIVANAKVSFTKVTGATCTHCGSSALTRTGSCYTCTKCGTTSGCS